jgi:hypothetical protein
MPTPAAAPAREQPAIDPSTTLRGVEDLPSAFGAPGAAPGYSPVYAPGDPYAPSVGASASGTSTPSTTDRPTLSPPPPGPYLRVVDSGESPAVGSVFPLRGTVEIGRGGESDIVVRDHLVSRYHCRLVASGNGNQFTVEDLNTPNGTLLNGRRLNIPMALNNGDLIQIGTTVLQFVAG